MHAAQRSRAYEGSALLLARDADVHAVDAAARTTLRIAAQEARSSQDPRVLCAYGADPAADIAREVELSEAVDRIDRYSATGPGELAGWLQLGGGCAQIAV